MRSIPQYGSKLKDKFSFLLGLRMESTRVTIQQLSSNDYSTNTYIGLISNSKFRL